MRFKTTIKCNGCVQRVSPFLNSILGNDSWSIDLEHPDKLLVVNSASTNPEVIISSLQAAGYQAELI